MSKEYVMNNSNILHISVITGSCIYSSVARITFKTEGSQNFIVHSFDRGYDNYGITGDKGAVIEGKESLAYLICNLISAKLKGAKICL